MSSSPESEAHIPHDLGDMIIDGADRSDSSVADNATISHDNACKFDQLTRLEALVLRVWLSIGVNFIEKSVGWDG